MRQATPGQLLRARRKMQERLEILETCGKYLRWTVWWVVLYAAVFSTYGSAARACIAGAAVLMCSMLLRLGAYGAIARIDSELNRRSGD